jgi:hypothetical protein
VLWDSTNSKSLVYVVTQNDSIYMFDGTNIPQNKQCTLIASNTSLIPTGETSMACGGIGGPPHCQTIAPTVGILGTPVVDEKTWATRQDCRRVQQLWLVRVLNPFF